MRQLLRKLFGGLETPEPSSAAPPADLARAGRLKKQGNAFLAEGNLLQAGLCYRAATLADPQDASAFINLGYVFCEQKNLVEASAALEQALALDLEQFDAHFMLGNISQQQGDMAKATSHFREILRLQPGFDFTAYFSDEIEYEKAVERYRVIISIDPRNAPVRMSLGMTSLLLGDYETGWSEYQWRFKVINQTGPRHKTFSRPLWLGEETLKGKTVLLHCEQGYGDTLQFCRYVAEVTSLGANVVLQVQPGLAKVLSGLAGVSHLLEENEPLPGFDFHCPLMSLPLALRQHRESGIPSSMTPYLRAESSRIEHWRKRLTELGFFTGPRIGVVWSGNPAHRRDLQRSVPLDVFLRALPPQMEAVCLQPDVREADMAVLNSHPGIRFLGQELSDFAETAALVASLDIVVTVDTSVAHLAGAMGKPVWVLLPHVPDWRWLLDRDDSAWYPTMRLFRQDTVNDWLPPLERVRIALASWANLGQAV